MVISINNIKQAYLTEISGIFMNLGTVFIVISILCFNKNTVGFSYIQKICKKNKVNDKTYYKSLIRLHQSGYFRKPKKNHALQ